VSELSNEFVCVEDPACKAREFKVSDFPENDEVQPLDESIFEAFDYHLQQMGRERFILGPAPLDATPMLGGMENGLIEYVANPDVVHAAIRCSLRHNNLRTRQMCRPGQQGVLTEQDFGTTRASTLSPKMFREFGFPVLQSRTQCIKQFVKYVFLHSCGNCWDLIDMFIDAKIDAYQSLQTGAGMDLNHLKDRFNNKLVFWGGIAVETLISGTPEDVRKNVKHAVNTAKTRKGIILGPSHSIAYGIPYDNFMAMMDEFHKNAYY
jgi:uroporphyrinogen-III decarboxylase